jgi:hypothetical protein
MIRDVSIRRRFAALDLDDSIKHEEYANKVESLKVLVEKAKKKVIEIESKISEAQSFRRDEQNFQEGFYNDDNIEYLTEENEFLIKEDIDEKINKLSIRKVEIDKQIFEISKYLLELENEK